MVLDNNNYKIENDGIWISKKELESWRHHYRETSSEFKEFWSQGEDTFKFPFYLGKTEVLIDILKMFEPLEL